MGEIKDLEGTSRRRQTAIRALEATIRLVETDQKSTEADGSVDNILFQKTALLLANKKLLKFIINQITAKVELLAVYIVLKKGIFPLCYSVALLQSYRY